MASTIRNMSKPLPPSRTAPQFVVRFPDEELRDRIKQAADHNGRSMNAEIIARLQDSLDDDKSNNELIESIVNLGRAYQRQEETIASQQRLIKQLAKVLRIFIEESQPNSPADDKVREHYLQFAVAMEAGDISKAVPHMEHVVGIGLDWGILSPDDHPATKKVAEQRSAQHSDPPKK